MMPLAMVMLGGGLGALARWSLTLIDRDTDDERILLDFPWATFSANVLASFVLGVVVRILGSSTDPLKESLLLLLATGFCGGMSTMSTFALELLMLVRRSSTVTAVGYLTLSMGCAMAAFWVGTMLVP
ncbi:CrcB family protein [Helcobacillus massiliensis]|uniref:fluoride efflux transporter FluC n=1 Tax=Helcobacillus TaxID=1161125 RepID=UPI001EF51C45|nr:MULTISPECIES: CrcB family protein [Helcobacillus]MCG7427677.1 CrcB family protein [Helcobacillus sp. ACRRO]MCT1556570.1 CrcB family protein [Helcobacillus massiliensis]MCT2035764.1 CrcB family protein [Helcobacillus massiliensis]MCT2331154.1 CrcB family protein [Helcobacillus massiliensis]MDK7741967.1 CrcB family protein [Helcobacillus massiliensis]